MATHAVTSQDFNQVVESNDLVFVDFCRRISEMADSLRQQTV